MHQHSSKVNSNTSHEQWLEDIQKMRIPVADIALSHVALSGHGAELGAGSAWFSCLVSKLNSVNSLVIVDSSAEVLQDARDYFTPRLQAKQEKLAYLQRDFHMLPFDNHSLDFVIVDAALHHTDDLPKLLTEIKRVLKQGGILLAIREPVTASLPVLRQIKTLLFGWRQRLHGDIEHTYTLAEWREYFHNSGFDFEPIPYSLQTSKKERILGRLQKYNGKLFGKYFFIAHSKSLTPT